MMLHENDLINDITDLYGDFTDWYDNKDNTDWKDWFNDKNKTDWHNDDIKPDWFDDLNEIDWHDHKLCIYNKPKGKNEVDSVYCDLVHA